MRKYLLYLIVLFTFTQAQKQDSILTYKLNDIYIKGTTVVEPIQVLNLKAKTIENVDAENLSGIIKVLPSIKIQNNSRGESLLFFRGSGKRQLSLMFDGVPLNMAWDNQIDLSLVPVNAVGNINITKGIPSALSGVNNLAGSVNIEPKKMEGNRDGWLKAAIGNDDYKDLSIGWIAGTKKFSYLVSAQYTDAEGFRLPASFNNEGRRRLNSFSTKKNFYSKFKYNYNNENSYTAISLFYVDALKGVPPEIGVSKVRYWRYPVWRRGFVSVSGAYDFSRKRRSILSYNFSQTFHKSVINSFTNSNYDVLKDKTTDKDSFLNARLVFSQLIAENSILKFSFNGYATKHTETEEDSNSNQTSNNTYTQNVGSLGLEYEFIHPAYSLTLGMSYDLIQTPKEFNNPDKSLAKDYSLNIGLTYKMNNNLTFQFSGGRKTRFPSLREALSTGGGKYVINPNLSAEVANSFSAGFNYSTFKQNTEFTLFLSYIKDGILRKALPGKQYIRINQRKIRNYGCEVRTVLKYFSGINFDLHFTLLNSFGLSDKDNYDVKLEYKPEIMFGLNSDFVLTDKLNFIAELNYIGKEYGYREGDENIQELPDYFLANLRVEYRFRFKDSTGELFLRVNNFFDKLYYTQWGLPEAGREYRAGVLFDI